MGARWQRFLFVGALALWGAHGVLLAQEQAAAAGSPLARGAKVTFERLGPADAPREVHSQRSRLLSIAVERGETATPFVSPGLFRATYRTMVSLSVRDRFRFRIEGRGSAKLLVNGESVLDGSLRPGKPLETAQAARLKKGDNELHLVFESAAAGDGQFRLFWSGPEFGFEPIAPELLHWAADDAEVVAGELLRHGQQVFTARHCARCHEPADRRIGESAFAELDAAGPDLRAVGSRARRDWLAAWLRDPHAVRADASMPKFDLGGEQAVADLATYLGGLGAPLPAEPFAADAAARGGERFLQLGCIACHVPPEQPRTAAALGDRLPLDFVPQKWHPAALVAYLQDPRRFYPHVRMPDLALSRDDAILLAAYLLAVVGSPLPVVNGDAERGRRLAQQHACGVCHDLEVPLDERQAPRQGHLNPEHGCLAEAAKARAKAPDHHLDAAQLAAVRAFLPLAGTAPFRRSPLDYAHRQLTEQRCTSCHGFDGVPSVWAQFAEQASAQQPLPADRDPRGQGVPALTWTGSKLQPSWITRFVLGKEPSPRPWLTARMPVFHLRGEAIVAGLVREHGYGPQDEAQVAADAQSAIHGERLVQMGVGFGCVQCHGLGDKPAVQVFERAGINLALARGRLRHEYYTRWLADPPRIDPDARMPKYADAKGRTAITDVLGGEAAQQFEAIWQFLGTQQPRR